MRKILLSTFVPIFILISIFGFINRSYSWDDISVGAATPFTVTGDFQVNGYNLDNVGVVSRIDPTSLGTIGVDGTGTGTVDIDFSANSYFTMNLAGTSTATIYNADDASGGVIEITQADANRAQLILNIADGGTFTASSALGLTEGAGAVDILVFLWNSVLGKYRVSIENSHQAIDQ